MAEKQITPLQFILRAIERLEGRNPKFPRGIHTVYSGFNDAYRKAFPERDPIADVDAAVATGKIEKRLVRGGAVIYLPGTAPARKTNAEDALSAIMADEPPPPKKLRNIELE